MTVWFDRPVEETVRVFKLKNGARVTFVSIPPYGQWEVKWSKGPTPPQLAGRYTDFATAYKEVEQYVKTRHRTTEILEEVLDGP